MEKNTIDNVKEQFITSVKVNLADLKERMSLDILNFELSVLYSNKIYDDEASAVQDVFTKLADDIDKLLNYHTKDCLTIIESLFSSIDLNKKVQKVSEIN